MTYGRLRLGFNLSQRAARAAPPPATPALKFNAPANSQYLPVLAI